MPGRDPDGVAQTMTGKYAPPEVTIRRYPDSPICDVVVVVRGREMVHRCRNYRQAGQWARLECKSYKIPEPATEIEPDDQVPSFFCFQVDSKFRFPNPPPQPTEGPWMTQKWPLVCFSLFPRLARVREVMASAQ